MDSADTSSMQLKKCNKCKIDKSFIEFHKKKDRKDGIRSECKKCISKHQKIHYSKPDIKKSRIERQRTPEYRLQQRKHHLKKNYGISIYDYDKMLDLQGNKCAVCKIKTPNGQSDKYFHIDHCHKTEKVRGLLCSTCNMGLGLFKENIEVLNNLIQYIKNNGSV